MTADYGQPVCGGAGSIIKDFQPIHTHGYLPCSCFYQILSSFTDRFHLIAKANKMSVKRLLSAVPLFKSQPKSAWKS